MKAGRCWRICKTRLCQPGSHMAIFVEAGGVLKEINAPGGAFGQAAIGLSTTAIKSDSDATYSALEPALTDLVNARDAVAGPSAQQLDVAATCGSNLAAHGRPSDPNLTGKLTSLAAQGRVVLDRIQRESRLNAEPD
jgi:hypothetical protein